MMKMNMLRGVLIGALLAQGAAIAVEAHGTDAAHRAEVYTQQTKAHMAKVHAAKAHGDKAHMAKAHAHPAVPAELKSYRHLVKDLRGGQAKAQIWIAASDVKSYYLALNQVVAAYPQDTLDQYRANVREVPTSYYVRDVLIPARKDAGLSVDGYQNYAYSMTTYQIEVVRQAQPHKSSQYVKHVPTEYRVAKISQKDYTADHQLLGEQTWNESLTVAAPGSDAYILAAGVDRYTYRFRPTGQ